MKKYAVYYKLEHRPETYIHIFAKDVTDARDYILANGVGYSNGPIIPRPEEITGVVEV